MNDNIRLLIKCEGCGRQFIATAKDFYETSEELGRNTVRSLGCKCPGCDYVKVLRTSTKINE